MSEHPPDEGWDDPEAEHEDEEVEAQSEDPTSPTRGFEDLHDLEEFEHKEDAD